MCILRSLWVIQLFSICCFSCVLSFSFYFFPYPRYFISLFTFSIFLYLNYLPTNSLYPLTYISVFSVYQSSPYFAFSLSSKSLPAESFFPFHFSPFKRWLKNPERQQKKKAFICLSTPNDHLTNCDAEEKKIRHGRPSRGHRRDHCDQMATTHFVIFGHFDD